MLSRKIAWTLLVLAAPLVFTACTNNTLDDGDSANVVLEVLDLSWTPWGRRQRRRYVNFHHRGIPASYRQD